MILAFPNAGEGRDLVFIEYKSVEGSTNHVVKEGRAAARITANHDLSMGGKLPAEETSCSGADDFSALPRTDVQRVISARGGSDRAMQSCQDL